jgi:HlyD family secretion protein
MRKPKKPVVIAIAAIVIAAVVWLVAFRGDVNDSVLEATGTVEGVEARVGFQRAGQVAEVLVREGDAVAAGQVLAVLDTAALHARRQQAAAQVAAARALLAELEAGSRPQEVAQATLASEAAAATLADARRDLERARTLYEGGVFSREAYDKARTAVEVQERQLRQAAAQADLVREGPRQERVDAQRAQVEQARASLAEIEAAIAGAVLRAPFAGVVTTRHREPGEIVAPGAPAISLLDRSDRWIRIYVPEGRLAAVRLGARATIRTDTYADRAYAGEVSHIASEAEFTPKTVQTQEERVKLVYSAKVRITGDPEYQLKPGMPADVSIPLPAPAASAAAVR